MMYLDQAIEAELNDPRWRNRTHGTLSCHNAGCRGELCKMRRRVYTRKQDGAKVKNSPLDLYLLDKIREHHAARSAERNAVEAKTA